MIISALFLLVVALYVFAYHYERNGDPWDWGDFGCRMMWSGCLMIGYVLLALPSKVFPLMVLWAFAGGFLEILVPHGYAMNLGRRATSWSANLPWYKYWPAVWLPHYTDAQYQTFSYAERVILDFVGMFCTGLLRGLIVFGLPSALGWFWHGGWVAVGITALWQPCAYLVGNYTNSSWFYNTPNSSQWGEFFVPIGWAVAFLVAVWL